MEPSEWLGSKSHCSKTYVGLGCNFWVRECPRAGGIPLLPCQSLWPFWYFPTIIISFGLNSDFKNYRHGKLSESWVGGLVLSLTSCYHSQNSLSVLPFSQLMIAHLYWGHIVYRALYWALTVSCQIYVISSNPQILTYINLSIPTTISGCGYRC